jgi:hypothetical protein
MVITPRLAPIPESIPAGFDEPAIWPVTLHYLDLGASRHHCYYLSRGRLDDTALRRSRVTFNSLKHIDPMGTIVLPALFVRIRETDPRQLPGVAQSEADKEAPHTTGGAEFQNTNHLRALRAFLRPFDFGEGVAPAIRKSSIFFPVLIAATNHRGFNPRPAHVSLGF